MAIRDEKLATLAERTKIFTTSQQGLEKTAQVSQVASTAFSDVELLLVRPELCSTAATLRKLTEDLTPHADAYVSFETDFKAFTEVYAQSNKVSREETKVFAFKAYNDTQGLIYWLGSAAGSKAFTNPACGMNPLVTLKTHTQVSVRLFGSTHVTENFDERNVPGTVMNRDEKKYFDIARKWLQIDLLGRKFTPTCVTFAVRPDSASTDAYYNYNYSNNPRNLELEAQNTDNGQWVQLGQAVVGSSVRLCSIPCKEVNAKGFSVFRLRSNHADTHTTAPGFALTFLEMYGTLKL